MTAPAFVRTIGGPGQALMYPSGLDVDVLGNIYVADTGNDRVEKYQAGTTNLLWSVGVRGAAIGGGTDSFDNPRDLATDGTNVYVADTDNGFIQVLSAIDGSLVRNVQSFMSGSTTKKFGTPIGITVGQIPTIGEVILVSDGVSGNEYVFDTSFNLKVTIPPTTSNEGTRDAMTDSLGNIYTADYRTNGGQVDKYDPSGNFLKSWGGDSAPTCQQVPKPYGVDVDDQDHVYIASSDLEVVKVFDTDGNCLNVGSTGSNVIGKKGTGPQDFFQLRRVAVGSGANPLVYGADLWGLKLVTYNSSDGSVAATSQPVLKGAYPPAGGLNEVHGVAVAGTNVFAMNTINQRVERYNLDGSNPFSFGTKGVAESTAAFNWAEGIGYDASTGNVWVANTRNNRIDAFQSDGTKVKSCPGTGQRLTSPLNWPMSVAFDPAGTMYVADTFNNRIAAFSTSGSTCTELWSEGTRGGGTNQFIKPWGVAYDATHTPARLLVVDTYNSRVVSLDPTSGAWNGVLPIGKGASAGQISSPEGIAVDAGGNIWIADTGNNRVEQFRSAGDFANQMVGGYGTDNNSFNAPQGLSFDASGLLYVADTYNNRIQVFNPGATGGKPSYLEQIYDLLGIAPMYPAGGAADALGNMYVADSGGSRIDKITPTGSLSYIVPDIGQLGNPRNLEFDSTDPSTLWIADTGNNQIVQMSTSGHVGLRFNSTTVSGLSMKAPFSLDTDATNLYVADTYNHRILALDKTDGHIVWTKNSCVMDTTSALGRVRDLTLGSDGNIYAADTDHNRVVKFSTAGVCLAKWSGVSPHAIKAPRAIASDGATGLWIVQAASNPSIVHFTNTGTYLGSTTNGGNFLFPEGVFTNGNNVVVGDPFAFQLETFTKTGANSGGTATVTNLGGPKVGGFNNPFGVAYDKVGNLYVSDMFNQRIEKFPVAGSPIATGQFGGSAGRMQNPRGISVTPDGTTVILTNSEDNRIDLFNAGNLAFQKSIVPTCGKMFWPHQTAYDPVSGTYWIADTNNSRILQVDDTGNCLQNWKGTGAAVASPRGIAWDGTNLWVANSQAGQVLKCTTAGSCSVVIARPAVNNPWNLTISNSKLYVADESAAKIRVFGLAGNLLYTFGSAGSNSSAGQFLSPRSVAVNPVNNKIAVADFDANLVSIWQ